MAKIIVFAKLKWSFTIKIAVTTKEGKIGRNIRLDDQS